MDAQYMQTESYEKESIDNSTTAQNATKKELRKEWNVKYRKITNVQ